MTPLLDAIPGKREGEPVVICPCGCIVEEVRPGMRKSVKKCDNHASQYNDPAGLGQEYYQRLGILGDDRKIKPTAHVKELVDALGDIPRNHNDDVALALEIGCGVSPYAPYIVGRGYDYLGIDAAPYAAEFTNGMGKGIVAFCGEWPFRTAPQQLILCAHTLEHVDDPIGSLKAMYDALIPGGWLVLLIPDDTDLCNPDHLHFFTDDGIRSLLIDCGFLIQKLAVRRIVPHENFIYILARTPGALPNETVPTEYPGMAGSSWLSVYEKDRLIEITPHRGRVLEVGSASGVTVALMAKARPETRFVSVDAYYEHRERCEHWLANRQPNQNLWVGELRDFAIICGQKFDLIFIDADHFYRGIYADLLHAAPLLKPGGLLVAHDYGCSIWEQVKEAVDRFCIECGFVVDEVRHSLVVLRRAI